MLYIYWMLKSGYRKGLKCFLSLKFSRGTKRASIRELNLLASPWQISLWYQKGRQAIYFFPLYNFTDLSQDNIIKKQAKKKGQLWLPLYAAKLSHKVLWAALNDWKNGHTHNCVETGEKAFDESFNELDLENKEA